MNRYALLLSLPALCLACSGSSNSIQPGMWETTVQVTADGQPLWTDTVSNCVYDHEATEARDLLQPMFLFGRWGPCTFDEANMADGVITARGNCTGRGGHWQIAPARISVEGRYTPATLEGRFSAEVTDGGERSSRSGTIASRRTGDC